MRVCARARQGGACAKASLIVVFLMYKEDDLVTVKVKVKGQTGLKEGQLPGLS